jgi:tetratricopeptide (TPR) repeat protein
MDRQPVWMVLVGGVIALILSSILVPSLKAANPQNADILTQILGGTTDFAADQAYREADVYFHAGFREHDPCEGLAGYSEGTESPAIQVNSGLPLVGLVRRLHGEMAPKAHRHLQGEEEKELLPWFIAAVRLNPHHAEAWRVGAYWFYRTGDLQRAEDFLREGILHNPDDYRFYLDRGIFYHRIRKWDKSVTDLETAEKLWKDDSEDAPYDLKAIRTFLHDSRMKLKEQAE